MNKKVLGGENTPLTLFHEFNDDRSIKYTNVFLLDNIKIFPVFMK